MNFRRTERPAPPLTESMDAHFSLCRWCIAGIMLPILCAYFVVLAWYLT